MIDSQLNPVSRKKRLRSVEAFAEEEFSVIDFRHVGILPAAAENFYLFGSEACGFMSPTRIDQRNLCPNAC